MNGTHVLDAVRRDPALYDLPGIDADRRPRPNRRYIALKAGATEYLRKPFDPGVLVVPVSALLSKAARVIAASIEAPSPRV